MMKFLRMNTTSSWFHAADGWDLDWGEDLPPLDDQCPSVTLVRDNIYHFFPIAQVLEVVFKKEPSDK